MKVFFLFFLAETILYYLIMQLKLYFEVIYHRSDDDDKLIVKILIFKSFELYSLCIPAIEFDSDKAFVPWPEVQIAENNQSEINTNTRREQRFINNSIKLFALHPKRLRRAVNMFFNWFDKYSFFMRKLIHSLRCEYFSWHTVCGTGDAATTALLTGCLWSVKGTVLKRIKTYAELYTKPSISIKPAWDKDQFATAFKCIFSIRIGHVITAVMKALLIRNRGGLANG